MLSYSYWLMTGWTPEVSDREIIFAIVIQGGAMGLLFTPLQVLAFVTLSHRCGPRGQHHATSRWAASQI